MAVIGPIQYDAQGRIVAPEHRSVLAALPVAGAQRFGAQDEAVTLEEGFVHARRILARGRNARSTVDAAREEFLSSLQGRPEFHLLDERSQDSASGYAETVLVYAIETPWQRLQRVFPNRQQGIGSAEQQKTTAFSVDASGVARQIEAG